MKVQQRMQKSHLMRSVKVMALILSLVIVEAVVGVALFIRARSVAYDGLTGEYQNHIEKVAVSFSEILEEGRDLTPDRTATLTGRDFILGGAPYQIDATIGGNLRDHSINIYILADLCTNPDANLRNDERVYVIYSSPRADGSLDLRFKNLADLVRDMPFEEFSGIAVFSASGRTVFVSEQNADGTRTSGLPSRRGGTPAGELANYRLSLSADADTTTTVKLDKATYALTVNSVAVAETYTVGGYADFTAQQSKLDFLRVQTILSLSLVAVASVALVIVGTSILNKGNGEKTYYFTVDAEGKIIERDKDFAADFPDVKELRERLSRFDEENLYTIQLPRGDEKQLMTCRVNKRFDGTVDIAASPLTIPSGSEVEIERRDTMSAVFESMEDQPRVLLGEIYFDNIQKIKNIFGSEYAEIVRNTLYDRVRKRFQNVYQFDYYNLGVLQPDGKQLDILLHDMDRVVSELNRVVRIGYSNVVVSVKCGFTLSDSTMKGYTHDEILATANAALKRACEPQADAINRVDYYIYHESQRKLYAKYLFQIDIPQMLKDGDFYLEYQPQYSLSKDKIIAFEALFRVNRRVQINVSIQDVINYAEQSGNMVVLGDFIFNTGMKFAKSIEGTGVGISLNVSLVQLMQAGFVDNFLKMYRSYDLKPGSISVEITESYLMQELDETLNKLNILRNNGIDIHLDDFGTKYSSFNYLKSLPIAAIKIDQSFVRDIHKNEYSRLITKTIVDISQSLHLENICEGVETAEQLAMVKSLGCDVIQGYVISRSVDEDTARDMIANYHYDQSVLQEFEQTPDGEEGKA